MPEETNLEQTIADAAAAPARVNVDGVDTQEHSLPDLIAADEYLVRKRASRRRGLPFRTMTIIPPGTV